MKHKLQIYGVSINTKQQSHLERTMKNKFSLLLLIVMLISQTGISKNNDTTIILQNLDKALSPFEDMTEYALNNNMKGIHESLESIKKGLRNSVFKNTLSSKNLVKLNGKLNLLKKQIKGKQYNKIALTSTDIFEFNISNFTEGNKIKNQIHVEHLDYMGFKVLALINQEVINWEEISVTIINIEKQWRTLRPKVSDSNLQASFDFLFQALHHSVKIQDPIIIKLLSNMDLSMVDVLENNL